VSNFRSEIRSNVASRVVNWRGKHLISPQLHDLIALADGSACRPATERSNLIHSLLQIYFRRLNRFQDPQTRLFQTGDRIFLLLRHGALGYFDTSKTPLTTPLAFAISGASQIFKKNTRAESNISPIPRSSIHGYGPATEMRHSTLRALREDDHPALLRYWEFR
jgi:hypothetical protein